MGELYPRGGPSPSHSAPRRILTGVWALLLLLSLVGGLGAVVAWLGSRAGLGFQFTFWQGVCLFLAVQVLLLPCYLLLSRNRSGTPGLS